MSTVTASSALQELPKLHFSQETPPQQLLHLTITSTSMEEDSPPASCDPDVPPPIRLCFPEPVPHRNMNPGPNGLLPATPYSSTVPHHAGPGKASTPGPCRCCRVCHSNLVPDWDPFPSLPRSLAQLPGGWGDANQDWQGHCSASLLTTRHPRPQQLLSWDARLCSACPSLRGAEVGRRGAQGRKRREPKEIGG